MLKRTVDVMRDLDLPTSAFAPASSLATPSHRKVMGVYRSFGPSDLGAEGFHVIAVVRFTMPRGSFRDHVAVDVEGYT